MLRLVKALNHSKVFKMIDMEVEKLDLFRKIL